MTLPTRRQRLTKMEIDRVDLVDVGANGRQFALLKRDVTTFAQLQASSELGTWLTPALDTLASVVWAALYPSSADEDEITVEQRLAAVAVSVDEFKEELVLKVGAAIGGQEAASTDEPVTKKGGTWAGILKRRGAEAPVRKGGGTWDGIL